MSGLLGEEKVASQFLKCPKIERKIRAVLYVRAGGFGECALILFFCGNLMFLCVWKKNF